MPNNVIATTMTANIKKMKNNIFEILAAPDSTPLNPSIPAITAIIKNSMA